MAKKGYSPEVERKVLTQMRRGVKAPRNIAKQAHLNASTVRVALMYMAREGKIVRISKGEYGLPVVRVHHAVGPRQAAVQGAGALGNIGYRPQRSGSLLDDEEIDPAEKEAFDRKMRRAYIVVAALFVLFLIYVWVR